MLMRTDPFREADRFAQQIFGAMRPAAMPMNAYRKGDTFFVQLGVPGVSQESIELTVEQNVLTIRAERKGVDAADEVLVSECPAGTSTRQIFLVTGPVVLSDRALRQLARLRDAHRQAFQQTGNSQAAVS